MIRSDFVRSPSLGPLALLVLCLAWPGCATRSAGPAASRYRVVTIQNQEPRRDRTQAVIDAHDGCLQFFAGRYFLYGTAYGRSAGFGINNRFRVYSSADLADWRFEGELIAEQPSGVFFRPYVVYNAKTHQYVLWFNWYPQLWEGLVGVAVSDTPVGPFRIVDRNVRLSQAKDRGRVVRLWADRLRCPSRSGQI